MALGSTTTFDPSRLQPGSIIRASKQQANPQTGRLTQVNFSFTIIKRLGSGAAGSVYSAIDQSNNRTVALKVLSSPETLLMQAFHREMQIVPGLSHPHIVQTYDALFVQRTETPVIAMELLQGRNLQDYLDSAPNHHLSPEQAIVIGAQLASALDYAHREKGIIHRDVKPDNVLVCEDTLGHPETVKLADFGIARSPIATPGGEGALRRITQAGQAMGTPEYMGPERWRGDSQYSSDIYALGIMLYLMVEGRYPFHQFLTSRGDLSQADRIQALNLWHASRNPEPMYLSADRPLLQSLILMMLDKDPRQRPIAASVHDQLKRMLRASERTLVLPIIPSSAAPTVTMNLPPPLPPTPPVGHIDCSDGVPKFESDELGHATADEVTAGRTSSPEFTHEDQTVRMTPQGGIPSIAHPDDAPTTRTPQEFPVAFPAEDIPQSRSGRVFFRPITADVVPITPLVDESGHPVTGVLVIDPVKGQAGGVKPPRPATPPGAFAVENPLCSADWTPQFPKPLPRKSSGEIGTSPSGKIFVDPAITAQPRVSEPRPVATPPPSRDWKLIAKRAAQILLTGGVYGIYLLFSSSNQDNSSKKA